jgi:putative DNA primase/helicase
MKKNREIEEQHLQLRKPLLADIHREQLPTTGNRPEYRVATRKPELKISATVFHDTKQESYYRVRYRTVDGERKEIFIGREMFRNLGGVVNTLLKAHAALPDDDKAAASLITKALSNRSQRRFRITSRTGWYGNSFVYVTQTFGPLARRLRHEGQSNIDPALGLSQGNGEAWRDGMREPCKYSDFLVFALSVPASGPLLDPVGLNEGAIYHLQPDHRVTWSKSGLKVKSSSGKTLAARAGLSEMGRCQKNDLVTFAATDRAVEDYCYAHNHLMGVFDEEGRGLSTVNNVKKAALPYLITSGVGKLRSNKAMQDSDLQNLRWALQVLSTGESPLDDPTKQAKRPEGAQVRMIPIPVPPGGKGGIFNRVGGSGSAMRRKCRELASKIETTIALNYGVAMPEYLRKLVAQQPTLERRVRKLINRFVAKVHADQDPWERRFAEKFGIVFAAAILLSEFGVGPWTKTRARIAITAIYKRARGASASVDEAATALVGRLRKLVKKGKRFPKVKKGHALPANAASTAWGAIVNLPNVGEVVACPHRRVERLVNPSAITHAVLRKLSNRGLVVKSSDGKLTRQVMVKGITGNKRQRFICFPRKKIVRQS